MATQTDPNGNKWMNSTPPVKPETTPKAGDAPGKVGEDIFGEYHRRMLRSEIPHHGVSHNGKPGGK